MAHKKAAGSAKNLRDSNPKYRGVKIFGGQSARMGNIIIRQKGDKYQLGENVYKGKDFTIHASIDGVVSFRKKKYLRYDGRKYLRTVVDVFPEGEQSPVPTASTPKTDKKQASKKEVKKESKKEVKKEVKKAPVVKDNKKDVVADQGNKQADLTLIEGIGPKIQEVLYAAGIMNYELLSTTKIADLRNILKEAGLSQHEPKNWKKQATLAKNEKWDELKKLQDELVGGK